MLRAGVACGCGAIFSPLLAQGLYTPNASTKANIWRQAAAHTDRALAMGTRVRESLDGLSSSVVRALELADGLRKRAGELATDIANGKQRKEALMEEYRNGLFCSGCGQTKSQILAKGETFPHSGQTIIRPTQAQIDAKDRELQRPIDDSERRLVDTKRDLDANESKASRGIEQIRLGVRFWRAASSYAELSYLVGAQQSRDELLKQGKEIETNWQRARNDQLTAKTQQQSEQADAEVKTWERLQQKNKADLAELSTKSTEAQNRVTSAVSGDRQRIDGYVQRGPLFAKVGGPPGILLYPSLSDPEFGALYQMGRIPEGTFVTLANASDFLMEYRKFGAEFRIGLMGSTLPVAPGTIPIIRPTTSTAPGGLLGNLP